MFILRIQNIICEESCDICLLLCMFLVHFWCIGLYLAEAPPSPLVNIHTFTCGSDCFRC